MTMTNWTQTGQLTEAIILSMQAILEEMKQEDVTVEEVLSISRMNTPVSDDSDDDETTAETDYLVTEVHRDLPCIMCNITQEQKVHRV